MPTLRSYLSESEYREITADSTSLITDQNLEQAETLIDTNCAEFYGSVLARSIDYVDIFEDVVATDTTITLNTTYSVDYWKYANIEILNGPKAGRKASIVSSDGSQVTFTSITGLTGVITVKIFQVGKFPMLKDTFSRKGVYYKTIPFEIKQAVAWQLKFMIENPSVFDSELLISENIGSSYSYTKGSMADKASKIRMLAPQTIQLLKPYLSQTI